MAGYTRQSVADIIANAIIKAAPVNAEFNTIRDAFAQATGHAHDGTSAEGAYVPLISDPSAFNKVVIDSINDRISFYSDVSSVAVEQIRIQDGVFVPVTDNDVDLGAVGAEFKDLYIDGVGYIDTLAVHENATVAGTLDVTGVITAPAGVVANITGNLTGNVTGNVTGNLTGNVTSTGTSTFSDLDAVDLSATGTTVITSGDINSGTIDNSVIGAATPAAGTFTTLNANTSLTAATADINGGTIDGATIGATSHTTGKFTTLQSTGQATLNTVDINGGNIDGTVIGAVGTAAGSFTTLSTSGQATLATADINGGTIDGATIGASSASTGAFTTVTASGGVTANLTGNVTGNVTGSLSGGTVTGNVTGNLTGNVTSAGTSTFNNVTIDGTLNMNAGTTATITNLTSPTNTNDAATKGYVDTQVSNLVDAAPGTLDTLNELAAALGDDPAFATTVTNSIATKLPLAGGTMTGAIAMSTNKITGAGDPTAAQDVATKAYVDTQDGLQVTKSGDTMSGNLAMGSNKVTGLAAPTDANDATSKTYVDGILGSATAASASAAAAATSESNAATSETNASNSASAAATSEANAAASYDNFDDRYLGAKSTAPTVDNDGDALIVGALYFNNTTNIMYVYSSGGWQAAGSSVNGTSDRNTYTATAGQTVFAATYDTGYVDVYLNGVKLVAGTDFTATNGTSITLATGAAVNDVVDIVAYGTFVLADHYTEAQSDARYVQVAGDSMTGNLSFGDNDKAIFGAGSDLEVYHDGANSRILENGTGFLAIGTNGGEISLRGDSFNDFMLKAEQNSAVTLYHNALPKLATTSTGIDVTGTVTADGLTVDGTDLAVSFNGSSKTFVYLTEGDTTDLNTKIYQSGGNFGIQTISDDLTTSKNRLKVDHATGDISFYEDTGTTPKFFWDASAEKLLIGDTSNSTASGLYIKTADPTDLFTGQLVLKGTALTGAADTGASIVFEGFNGSGNRTLGSIQSLKENSTVGDSLAYMRFSTFGSSGTQERMRIDSSGNIKGSKFASYRDASAAYLDFVDAGTANDANGDVVLSGYYPIIFKTDINQERMRLDRTGNLLVGTTSSVGIGNGSTNEGINLSSTQCQIAVGTSSDVSLYLNRMSSDGTIAEFRKNGSAVGAIGTTTNSYLWTGGTNSGIFFYNNGFGPSFGSSANGQLSDGGKDIGASGNRFKDLYLSGGVYLGGTGAANKLDDYEEGSFTPALDFGSGTTGITYNAASGKYIKVGSLVTVWIYIALSNKGTSTGQASVSGLPFAINNPAGVFSPLGDRGRVNTGGEGVSAYISGGAAFPLYSGGFDGGVNAQVSQNNFQNSSEIDIVTSYFTNS